MRKLVLGLLLSVLAVSAVSAFPQRIVSGIPSATEMLFALGLGDRVVGVTTNCNYPPEAAKKEKVGALTLNLEKVVSLKPDLVVMLADAQPREIERLRAFGLPVFTIEPRTVAGVEEALLRLGAVTGATREAAELVGSMQERLESLAPPENDLRAVLRRPRVLVIVGYEPLIVAGGGTFIDDILGRAGVENLAAPARGAYPHFSLERLLKERPDYIIVPAGVVRRGELEKRGEWSVIYLNPDIVSRPGPRVVEAVEAIARACHEKKI
ncbi:MAG: ABC transporter substrate-binding protein [Candidatus Margulisiibacteriota bacterium]